MRFNKKIELILFVVIVLVASFLRLWQLGHVPASPDWDEAALGYNAYSLKETGKDEYGASFPIILRSFDDYKPALYAYFVIPFIFLFGLDVFAVRLVSALFGIATVVIVYFILKELIEGRKSIPLLASFILAISPWHIQFSRIAFESNVGLALNVFSILFFIKGVKKPVFLLLYTLCAGLSLYVYQSEKVFVPLLFILLVFIYKNELFKLPKKFLVLSLIIGIVIAFPIVHYTLTKKEALTRAQGVSVFSEDNQYLNDLSARNLINRERGDFIGLIFDNRRIFYAKSVIANYLSHYNIYWLFLSGDENRHHAPSMGLLYLWEFPFLFIGIYSLLFGKWNTKLKLLTFGLFLLAPVPAAFTTGVPHSVRTLNFLPTFQIFTAIGLVVSFLAISKIKLKYLIFALFTLFFIFNFSYYLNQYFVQQNYFYSQAWQYGYKEALDYIKEYGHKYNKIIVSNQPHLDQSYIFFLFYLKYSPVLYQKEVVNSSGGFAENHYFGKFEFRPIVWEKEIKNSKTLYIGRPNDFNESGQVIKTIYFLDNNPAIKIVEG
jgi:4-amino-4-deoxy-L-arabinose transferase-like glycosyltransferase